MDIEAVTTRCEAATKGPWTWKVGGTVESATFEAVCKSTTGRCHDMSFIAHARTDLPDAIELIEELTALVWQVSRQSEHIDCDGAGCWLCGAECGTKHRESCVAAHVLAKVRKA